ncbi:hypothetical protein NEMBOFW57_008646 [Staphylotrichum longicolle]|uniref:UDP-N-acetylglucosamine transferase subunit ALG13 n=1 Tax=Staphylotrichum longicolle TaxID=669026 RepID=A0AAD4HW11_9PEZI|nr:hypothetical protein NEMBOFW57_008646 [Staphylotrichum longicolle]
MATDTESVAAMVNGTNGVGGDGDGVLSFGSNTAAAAQAREKKRQRIDDSGLFENENGLKAHQTTAPPSRPSLPGRRCFVTVGATAGFRSLLEEVSSAGFLQGLAEHGYTLLDVQCGPDQAAFDDRIAGLRNEDRHGVEVRSFAYTSEMQEYVLACRGEQNVRPAGCVISHGGTGTVGEVLGVGAPLIVVANPTLMDNHQLELAESLEEQNLAIHGRIGTLVGAVGRIAERITQGTLDALPPYSPPPFPVPAADRVTLFDWMVLTCYPEELAAQMHLSDLGAAEANFATQQQHQQQAVLGSSPAPEPDAGSTAPGAGGNQSEEGDGSVAPEEPNSPLPIANENGNHDAVRGGTVVGGGLQNGENTALINFSQLNLPLPTIGSVGDDDHVAPSPGGGQNAGGNGHIDLEESDVPSLTVNGNGISNTASGTGGGNQHEEDDGLIDLDEATLPFPAINGSGHHQHTALGAIGIQNTSNGPIDIDELAWVFPTLNGNGHHHNAAPVTGGTQLEDSGLIDLDEANLPLPTVNGDGHHHNAMLGTAGGIQNTFNSVIDLDEATLPLPTINGNGHHHDAIPLAGGNQLEDDRLIDLDEAALPLPTINGNGHHHGAPHGTGGASQTGGDSEPTDLAETYLPLPAVNGNGPHHHAPPALGDEAQAVEDDGLIDLDEATLPLPTVNGNGIYHSQTVGGANLVEDWDGVWAHEAEADAQIFFF